MPLTLKKLLKVKRAMDKVPQMSTDEIVNQVAQSIYEFSDKTLEAIKKVEAHKYAVREKEK